MKNCSQRKDSPISEIIFIHSKFGLYIIFFFLIELYILMLSLRYLVKWIQWMVFHPTAKFIQFLVVWLFVGLEVLNREAIFIDMDSWWIHVLSVVHGADVAYLKVCADWLKSVFTWWAYYEWEHDIVIGIGDIATSRSWQELSLKFDTVSNM